jgi:hypothetical protein
MIFMTPVAEKPTTQLPADRAELVALMREVYRQERNAAGKKVLSLEEIREAFLALPGEETRAYEVTVAAFSRDWADSIIKKKQKDDPEPLILQLLPKPGAQLTYGSEEEKIAFAAFAVAINYERLQKNPREEGELLETYREFFGAKHRTGNQYVHPYFFHLDVLFRMDLAPVSNDAFLLELLQDAKINSRNLTQNHGGHHAYAETAALVFENASTQLRAQLEAAPEHWLEDAKTSAIKALAQDDNYAKYYCTYARLLAQTGDMDEALKNVSEAIAREKNTRTDYSIRIGQYSSYYQQFRAQKKLQEQEAAMAEQMQQMHLAMEAQEKETMAKNMEFLGLFSGIVSFTIGSLTITGAIAEQSIRHAAGLIVVLLGALMCVFAAFGMILHGFHAVKRDAKTQKYKRSFLCRHLVVFVLGVLVVAGGILFCLM